MKSATKLLRRSICLPPSGVPGAIFPWVCWAIWKDRNGLIFEGKSDLPTEIATKGLALAREWSEAQTILNPGQNHVKATTQQLTRARESPQSILCISVCKTDAAWDSTRNKAGLAWIIAGGATQESSHGFTTQDYVNSALIAEALAVREGLFTAANQGISNLWMCSDNLTLIRAINYKIQRKEILGIINDIHDLASGFVSIVFHHIHRKENDEADALAKAALRNSTM